MAVLDRDILDPLYTCITISSFLPCFADEDNNSNSSNDSDQLQAGGSYIRGSQTDGVKSSVPVCRHESISITAMEDCPTDHEVLICS